MRKLLLIVVAFTLFYNSNGQFSIAALNTTYTQDLNGMGTGSGTWTNNSTMANWYAARTGTGTSITAGTGSSTTGDLYNFGSAAAADRALGSLGSGNAAAGNFAWGYRMINNTGSTIYWLAITHTGEQWRDGGGTGLPQTVGFYYLISGSAITTFAATTTGYMAASTLDFVSPKFTGTAGLLDGNLSANRVTYTDTISVNIPNGSEIMIKWYDIDHPSNDHGLSTDDLSVTAFNVLNFYSKNTGSLHNLATWGTNTDGTGNNPSNFTDNGQIFNIRNNATPTLTAGWVVSGTNSKIILGDGVAAINYTIPSGFSHSGTAAMDISNNATLTINNTTIPAFGTINVNSTVIYATSAIQAVTTTTYGNLSLTGTGTKTFGGATTIAGAWLIDNAIANATGASSVTFGGNLTVQNSGSFSSGFRDNVALLTSGNTLQTIRANGITITGASFTSIKSPGAAGSGGMTLSTTGGSTNLDIKGDIVIDYDVSGANYSIFTTSTNTITGGRHFKIGRDGQGASTAPYVFTNGTIILTGESATTEVEISENVSANTTPTINCFFNNLHIIKSALGTWTGTFRFRGSSNTTININGNLLMDGVVTMEWEDVSPTPVSKPLLLGGNITLKNGAVMGTSCKSYLNLQITNTANNVFYGNGGTVKCFQLNIIKSAGSLRLASTGGTTTVDCLDDILMNLTGTATFTDSANTLIVGDDLLLTAHTVTAGDSIDYKLTGTFRLTGQNVTGNALITDAGGGTATIDVAFNNLEIIKTSGTWKAEFSSSTTSTTPIVVKNNLTLNGAEAQWDNTAQTKTFFIGGNITLLNGGEFGTTCRNNMPLTTIFNKSQLFKGNGDTIKCFSLNVTKSAGSLKLGSSGGATTIDSKDDLLFNLTGTSTFTDSANTLIGGDDLLLTAHTTTNGDSTDYKLTGKFRLTGESTSGNVEITDVGGGTATIDAALNNLEVVKTSGTWKVQFNSSTTSTTPVVIKSKLTLNGVEAQWDNTAQTKTLFIGGDIELRNNGEFGTTCRNNMLLTTIFNKSQVFKGNGDTIKCFNFTTTKSAGGVKFGANTFLDVKQDLAFTYTGTSNFTDSAGTIIVGDDFRFNGPSRKWSGFVLTGTVRLTGEQNDNIDIEDGSNNVCDAELHNLTINVATTGPDVRIRPTAGSDTLVIKGNFTISAINTGGSKAVLSNGNRLFIGGNWTNFSAAAFNETNSKVIFNGTALQTLSNTAGTEILNNVALNNSAGLQLNDNLQINGNFDFINGVVKNFVSGKLLVFADNATTPSTGTGKANHNSFVNGKVQKTGNDAFVFPVGKELVGVHPAGISAPATITDQFVVEYKSTSAKALGPIKSTIAAVITNLSECEYWDITNPVGSNTVNIALYYNPESNCGSGTYISDTSKVFAVHFDGAEWNAYGHSTLVGNADSGIITWNGVNTFSPFSLGSSSLVLNPLPIELISFTATKNSGGVIVNWKTSMEVYCNLFDLEKSSDGKTFYPVYKTNCKGLNGNGATYAWQDININGQSTVYYRLRMIDQVKPKLSNTVAVYFEPVTQKWNVYPSPFQNEISIRFDKIYAAQTFNYTIADLTGKSILNGTLQINSSDNVSISNLNVLQKGVYFITISNDLTRLTTYKIVKD